MATLRLTLSQRDMLLDIYGEVSGFCFEDRTARSLVKRGFLEQRGLLEFRLTVAGVEVCKGLVTRGGA